MSDAGIVLVAKVGARTYGLPIACVVETMRPMPVRDAASGALCGTSIVRGAAIPIVDAARLVGASSAPTRLVVLRAGEARVGLLVDAVLGVHALASGADALAIDVPGLPPALSAVIASARIVESAA